MAPRERKRDPHHCAGCGADFEVAYYDDRRASPRAAAPPVLTDVRCPRCGSPRSVSVPAGAERTLMVELDEGEADEGGGG
jgi:DNA-directed RNA polymerase subunit RPC12/RpoP